MTEINAYQAAFKRMWSERNDERIVIFANGHEYNKAERRKAIRQNIGCQRRMKNGD